jgi:hypothetical protein
MGVFHHVEHGDHRQRQRQAAGGEGKAVLLLAAVLVHCLHAIDGIWSKQNSRRKIRAAGAARGVRGGRPTFFTGYACGG